VTIVLTVAVIGFCLYIRYHYHKTEEGSRRLDEMMLELAMPDDSSLLLPRDTDGPTAVCFVKGYNGLGFHEVLAVPLLFGTHFENFVFAGVGVIGASRFKGREEIDNLRRHTEQGLRKYITLVNRRGYCAEYCYALGTDPIDELERLAHKLVQRFPRAVFFAAKRIFKQERFLDKVLHNQAAFTLERRLQFAGLQMVVLSVCAT